MDGSGPEEVLLDEDAEAAGAAFWQLGALEVQHIWTSASAIKRAYCMALFTLLAPACARRALCQAPTKGLYLGQFSVT